MSNLTPEARHENALALAAAAGVSTSRAAELLNISVLITHDPSNSQDAQLASETCALLRRTLQSVMAEDGGSAATIELVLGSANPRSEATKVFAALEAEGLVIGTLPLPLTNREARAASILILLSACYLSAAILHRALGKFLPYAMPEPFILRFSELGIERAAFDLPVNLGRSYQAGAGAIGNAILWAGRHVDLRGELVIADDDVVDSGNLNRQVWFSQADLGLPKAVQLVHHAQPSFSRLKLIPEVRRIQDLPQKTEGPWLSRLLVAVDSRRARRELQSEIPGEVFDASTTDIREVVSFYAREPSDLACLSCIYSPDQEEHSREHHIAEHLGVSVSEVRTERISRDAATRIVQRYTNLDVAGVEGVSYDTLFKRLCSENELRSSDGQRIVAPFAFVSCLAGTYLVLDLIRRLTGAGNDDFNYWRLSAWHPPLARRRELRRKQSDCMFCGNVTLSDIASKLWS